MPATTDRPGRKLLWFVLLWLAGVTTLAAAAAALRWLMGLG